VHPVGREHSGVAGQLQLELLRHCGLRPDTRLLEIGCGIGRLVYELAPLLDTGRYSGFDIAPAAIAWLNSNYAPLIPNFDFRLLDVTNARYRPEKPAPATRTVARRARRQGLARALSVLPSTARAGRTQPPPRERGDRVRWPYDDDSFDMACAFSVFTHMRFTEVCHYLTELRRVLVHGGRGVMTFFAIQPLDTEPRLGPDRPFVPMDDGVSFTTDLSLPERAIAFRDGAIREAIDDAGLRVHEFLPGFWRGGERAPVSVHKDVFVLTPR
jgi:SAM-dependent methyltransferase